MLTSQEDTWRRLLGDAYQERAVPVISLAEIFGAPSSLSDLKTALLQGFQEELGLSFESGDLTPWEEHCLSGRSEASVLPDEKGNTNKYKKRCP